MSKYLKIPFPVVENPFDGHIHIHKWREESTGELYIHGLEEYRNVCGLKYIALASLPSGNPIPAPRDVSNNIMCAFYKLANENTYAYGGFIYPSYPAKVDEMTEMSLLTQLDELNEIGFDGVLFTDAVNMKAMSASFEHEDVYIESFLAGHPDREAILEGQYRFDAESAREIYKEMDFLPNTQWGYSPCLCGRKCDIACYRHLVGEL